MEFEVAVTIALPGDAAIANPELVTEAVPAAELVHVTTLVRSWVLLSLNVPIAFSCCELPLVSDEVAGDTARETNGAGTTARVAEPLSEPEVAEIVAVPCCLETARPEELILAVPG